MGKLPMTRYELTRLEGLLSQLLEQGHEDAGATAHQLDAILDTRNLARDYREALPAVDAFTARRAKQQAAAFEAQLADHAAADVAAAYHTLARTAQQRANEDQR